MGWRIVARGGGSSSAKRCPEVFAPDVHGPRRAARREPFRTVATPQAGVGGTREMGSASFSSNGEDVFLNGRVSSPKEKPAISGRQNGVPLAVKKHAVRSVFSARNRQSARRKASFVCLSLSHASERSEHGGAGRCPAGSRAAPWSPRRGRRRHPPRPQSRPSYRSTSSTSVSAMGVPRNREPVRAKRGTSSVVR